MPAPCPLPAPDAMTSVTFPRRSWATASLNRLDRRIPALFGRLRTHLVLSANTETSPCDVSKINSRTCPDGDREATRTFFRERHPPDGGEVPLCAGPY